MTTSFYPDRPEAKRYEAVLFSRQPEVVLTGNRARWQREPKEETTRLWDERRAEERGGEERERKGR